VSAVPVPVKSNGILKNSPGEYDLDDISSESDDEFLDEQSSPQ